MGENPNKLFYSIGEVAEMFNENTSLIRYWSNTFKGIIKPEKNKKGNRLFTPKDIQSFKIIHHLVKERGMTLEGAKQRMLGNREGEDREVEIIGHLNKIKEMLLEVKELISD